MGEVVKLHNSIVVDQEFISQIWYHLNILSRPKILEGSLTNFHETQEDAADLCSALAIKMAEQDCGLGDIVISSDPYALQEWLIPVKAFLKNQDEAVGE